jgi:hypothetical protein
MSLSRQGGRQRRVAFPTRTLGINQLGAVYEALLSFRGFFAEEDLYEVRPDPKQEGQAGVGRRRTMKRDMRTMTR